MARLAKVLVPVEFSPRCLGSAQYAEALACHFHCSLTLLHVVKPPYLPYSAPDVAAYTNVIDLDSGLIEQAQTSLDSFPIGAPAEIDVERVVLEGDPASLIVDYARENHFDLIVIPTHGYGPFRRFVLGSVTAKVLHDAQCPVWTGPHMETAPAYSSVSFRNILCALDLQSESRTVLGWAASLAREFGAKLNVVHVIHRSLISAGGALVSRASQEIASLQTELQSGGDAWIEKGETPETIRETAQRLGAELLVIGRGRHAYAILRESPCPAAAV